MRESKRSEKPLWYAQLCFLVLLFLLGAVFIYCWLARFGNTPQVFTDVVEELTSAEGSNKSAEQDMVYLLSILGAFAVFLFYLFYNRGVQGAVRQEASRSMSVLGLLLMTALGAEYLIYGEFSIVLFALTMLWILLYVCGTSFAFSAMISFVLSLYALCGIYRAYVFFGGSRDAGLGELTVVSLLITGLMLAASHKSKKDLFLPVIAFIQLLIPLTLLVFLASSYKYGEEIIKVEMPKRISLPVWAVLIFFVVLAAFKIKKSREKAAGADELISFGTLCCIMNFNGYSGCGQIVSSDLHHPFENIIAFSQIFELGQKPFSEYIPVSGLYSVIQGAFLAVFGKGYYAYYNVTENMFYLAVAALLIFFATRQLKGSRVLLIAMLFPLLRYNRIALILPVMLLLSWPALIKKKNLWIQAWFISSFIQGLYYPLFGAAVCIAFMPMLLWQVISYAKSDLKKDIKKPAFWFSWLVCILPVILCIPLLLGTLKHMLAMSSQTVFADGLSRFGQGVPDNFFADIQSDGLRILLYDLFSFLIPVAVIWVSAILAMKLGGIRIENKRLKIEDPEAAALGISAGIAMLVAFSYTFVRMDVYDIYARSAGMIFACAIMFLVIGGRYMGNSLMRFVISAFAIFLIAAVGGEGMQGIDCNEKVSADYDVSYDYVGIGDGEVPRLGTVFINGEVYDKLLSRRERDHAVNSGESYLGLGDFGYYYLYDIKGGSVMEAMTIRGYGAAKETIDILRDKGTVVSGIDSFAYYYLYRWLMTSGEYSWSADNRKFYPSSGDAANALAANKNAGIAQEWRELGLTPSSWGLSMDSLNELFTAKECSIEGDAYETSVKLNGLQGGEADFLYIAFDNSDGTYENILIDHIFDAVQEDTSEFATALMKRDHNPGKTVNISWEDDNGEMHGMNCAFGQGKLLIPLGSGAGWLLNSHSGIDISLQYNGENIELPKINEYRLLKLREVE